MLKKFFGSAVKMIVTVLAPEFIIGEAYDDLSRALLIKRDMSDYAGENGMDWTLTHSYYVVMGGFVVQGNPDPLTIEDIPQLQRTGEINSLLNIKVEELEDKSKNDMFGKIIAVGQILWTLVQIIARAVQRLPVSPLEIAVAAFAICAVIINGLYWYKPQRVSTPITITCESHTEEGTHATFIETPDEMDSEETELEEKEEEGEEEEEKYNQIRFWIPLPGIDICYIWSSRAMRAAAIGTAIFGGVHVIAWNFAFPTKTELICWRCASVYSAAFPLSWEFLLGMQRAMEAHNVSEETNYIVRVLIEATFLPLYIVARLFILVEIFRTLFFLPAGSFVSTWASNIPHVG
jgi:hypothetical protein